MYNLHFKDVNIDSNYFDLVLCDFDGVFHQLLYHVYQSLCLMMAVILSTWKKHLNLSQELPKQVILQNQIFTFNKYFLAYEETLCSSYSFRKESGDRKTEIQ